jgi:hypothetical protein
MYVEGEQTVTELYTDCKVHCEEGQIHFGSFGRYREILICEFILQFFELKKVGISKTLKEKEKRGKEFKFHYNHEEKI